MITVEELIIQSLYHRLVVINVKKTGVDIYTGHDDGTPVDPQRQQQNQDIVLPDVLVQNDGSKAAGLGAMYVGPFSPDASNQGHAQPIPSSGGLTEQEQTESQTNDIIRALMQAGPGPSSPDAEFTDEVGTLLQTGNLKLKRAVLKTAEHRSCDAVPIWYFGPDECNSAFATTPTEEGGGGDAQKLKRQSTVPTIDLDKCDQFSILQIQDLRHPERKNLVMIQTPDAKSTRLNRSQRSTPSGSGALSPPSKCSSGGMPSPVSHSDTTPVFVRSSVMSPVPSKPPGESAFFHEHEIDSGIWDLHGHDSIHSTRESTPIVSMNSSLSENHPEHSAARSAFAGGSDVQSNAPFVISRKVYTVEEDLSSAVLNSVLVATRRVEDNKTPPTYESLQEEQVSSHQGACNFVDEPLLAQSADGGLQAYPNGPSGDYWDIHVGFPQQSHPQYSAGGDDIITSPGSQALRREGLNELHDLVLDEDQVGEVNTEEGVNEEDTGSRCDIVEPVATSKHQMPTDEGVLRRYASPLKVQVTQPGEDEVKHHHHVQQDDLTVVQRASQHAVMQSRHAFLPSPKLSPNKCRGDLLQYSPGSECEGSPDLDSNFTWDSDESMVSSMSTVSELVLQNEFESFPDWMGQLPESLQRVPLSCLTIPGSHISLAIDRDMRSDMDFSKCNYEMAEFLRKLPNLNIFNNFRSLMKRIWRAWMPKQRLNISEQLEAGVRYFDMHVTKYRNAFYAEHGLYTKQFKKYLREVKDFCDAHPREVVIIHFSSLDQLDKSDKRRLVTMLFQIFGARLSKVCPLQEVTLQNFWSKRKQFMVIFPNADMEDLRNHIFGGLIWSDYNMQADMPKKDAIPQMLDHLDDVHQARCSSQEEERLHLLRAVLSPDMSMVFGEYKYKSMRQLTNQETNPAVGQWLKGRRNLNIVALDFVECGDIVRQLLQLNTGSQPRQETVTDV